MNNKNTSPSQNEEKPCIYNPNIRRLEKKGKLTQNDYIQAFGLLPDYILKANGILSSELNEGDLGELLKSYRDAFQAMKKWLVLFDNTTNNSQAFNPPILIYKWENDYKPHAEESYALLNLCTEILNLDPFGWKESFASLIPAELWFSCEFEKLEHSFQKTGILGTSTRIGKQKSCDTTSQQIREDFDSLPSRKFGNASDFEPHEIQRWDSTEDAIKTHAEYIAQSDPYFCHHIYADYIKKQKCTLRHIRNHSDFQFSALEKDGSLFVGGQGKRGKGKKSSKSKKGFGVL